MRPALRAARGGNFRHKHVTTPFSAEDAKGGHDLNDVSGTSTVDGTKVVGGEEKFAGIAARVLMKFISGARGDTTETRDARGLTDKIGMA